MEKKRSKGVTILAWLMIIVNAYAFASSLNFRKNFFDVYISLPRGVNISIIAYCLLSAAIGVIAGFGILQLKEKMRKLGVAINAIDVLAGLGILSLTINDIRQYVYTIAASAAVTDPKVPVYALASATFYVTILLMMLAYGFNLLLIFFFTRPKVKEQFK